MTFSLFAPAVAGESYDRYDNNEYDDNYDDNHHSVGFAVNLVVFSELRKCRFKIIFLLVCYAVRSGFVDGT